MANPDTPRLSPLAWWRIGDPNHRISTLTRVQYHNAHLVGIGLLDGMVADLNPSQTGFGERIDETIRSLRTDHNIYTAVIPAPKEQEAAEQIVDALRRGYTEARIAMSAAAGIDHEILSALQQRGLDAAGGRIWLPDTLPAGPGWIPEGLVPSDGLPILNPHTGKQAGAAGSAWVSETMPAPITLQSE